MKSFFLDGASDLPAMDELLRQNRVTPDDRPFPFFERELAGAAADASGAADSSASPPFDARDLLRRGAAVFAPSSAAAETRRLVTLGSASSVEVAAEARFFPFPPISPALSGTDSSVWIATRAEVRVGLGSLRGALVPAAAAFEVSGAMSRMTGISDTSLRCGVYAWSSKQGMR